MITELDLEIINALQINPRADSAQVAEALGLSGPTVARRWKTLCDAGLAWVTPAPGANFLKTAWSAFLLLTTVPSEQEAVVRRLCAEPAFATVSIVSGPHDVLVDCFVSSHADLMSAVTDAVAGLPGVTGRDVVFVTELYRNASDWRSDTLEPAKVRRMAKGAARSPAPAVPDALDARLLAELANDGRASWVRLGTACGISAQTARRRVERIFGSGCMSLRCDTSLAVQQGLREVNLSLNVPAVHVEAVGRYFGNLPSCRVSAQVLGVANLLVTLWVRDYLEVQGHELELAVRAPGSTVISRGAVLRTCKRLGHVLDPSGQNSGVVPMPLWRDA